MSTTPRDIQRDLIRQYENLQLAVDTFNDSETIPVKEMTLTTLGYLLGAQVEATLLLVEEQRVANVIARAHAEAVLGGTGKARSFLDSV